MEARELEAKVCARCKVQIQGAAHSTKWMGQQRWRCQACHDEVKTRRKARGKDLSIISKKHGKCQACGKGIRKGDHILWRQFTAMVWHPKCWLDLPDDKKRPSYLK